MYETTPDETPTAAINDQEAYLNHGRTKRSRRSSMPSREVANGGAAEEEPARRRRPRGVVANEEDEHARRESESSVQKVNSNPAHVGYFKFK